MLDILDVLLSLLIPLLLCLRLGYLLTPAMQNYCTMSLLSCLLSVIPFHDDT